MPSWLEPLLPEVRVPVLLDTAAEPGDTTLWSHYPDGEGRPVGADVEAAFSGHVLVPGGSGYVRMLGSTSDADRVSALVHAWSGFKEWDAAWRRDPSFLNAFSWVDQHPAFWIREYETRPDEPGWRHDMLWAWKTDGHMQRVEIRPIAVSASEVVITLETGAHVEEEQAWDRRTGGYIITGTFRGHYYDPRLDVVAPTFEQAVKALALRIDKVFYTDGTERPDAPKADVGIPEDTLEQMERERAERPPLPYVAWADLRGSTD